MKKTPQACVDRSPGAIITAIAWSAVLIGVAAGLLALRHRILNVVNYSFSEVDAPGSWIVPAAIVTLVLVVALLHAARFKSRPIAADLRSATEQGREVARSPIHAAWPMLLSAAVGVYLACGAEPTFVSLGMLLLGIGWSVGLLGRGVVEPPVLTRFNRLAPYMLGAVIVAVTAWHAAAEANFWRHFLFGYADFGFFTTELEHCLPWTTAGAARFADTRMGYHAVPMFYLLAPLYAVFRTPVFLMVVGPLALNLAAVPFYRLAKSRTGSSWAALAVALAWLALPSLSRLPYANTYGFQSVYLAVPLIAWFVCLELDGRRRASFVCLIAAVLCEETVCGVALGWGIYLAIWGGRRRDGALVAAGAVAYLLLCTLVIIPAFAAEGDYSRLDLFGGLTPWTVYERLTRPRVFLYLFALIGPMLPFLWRHLRLLVAVLPTLGLILIMQDADYLNIKYWHQSSILPFIFAGAVLGVTGGRESADKTDPAEKPTRPGEGIGASVGLLLSVMLFHVWLGFSPFSQAHRLYAGESRMHDADPRMGVVDAIRERFVPQDTVVLATERLAAHFTDYRMVYPVSPARIGEPGAASCVLIVDRRDGWDKIIRGGGLDSLLVAARDKGFEEVLQSGSISVLWKRPD